MFVTEGASEKRRVTTSSGKSRLLPLTGTVHPTWVERDAKFL
jgi:hypothetical protein